MISERVMVVINNYHGYWEYGVSAFLPWNTAQAVARRTAEAMLSYGDMGLGTWNAQHVGKRVWNVPVGREAFMVSDYYPNMWSGNLANIDVHGNNRALNYTERKKFVFVVDGDDIHEASAQEIAEEFGGKC